MAKNRNEKNKKTNGIETGLFGESDKMISSWVEKILKGGKYIFLKNFGFQPFPNYFAFDFFNFFVRFFFPTFYLDS